VTEHSTVTIGLDLGDKFSQLCVLDDSSKEIVERSRVRTTLEGVERYFTGRSPARVVMEVGTHSGWVSRKLSDLGQQVLVADPRRVRALAGDQDKDDRLDAEFLARVGCLDAKLLKPIHHRSAQTQVALAQIRARDRLVQVRTKLVNCVRGLVKTVGQRLPSCSALSFHKLESQIPTELAEAVGPLMVGIATLNQQIRRYDQMIKKTAETEYPQAVRLQQVAGVGPVTSLAYTLIIEDPSRFAKSRAVGPYLGLCPRRYQSGDANPELNISKRGDRLLRRLLVLSAHYILGAFGPDSDLRRWGLAHCTAGGTGKKNVKAARNAKKRAVVAVARKLAVLLHSLWITGQDYEPLRLAQREATKAAAIER
jgi:transposase